MTILLAGRQNVAILALAFIGIGIDIGSGILDVGLTLGFGVGIGFDVPLRAGLYAERERTLSDARENGRASPRRL